MKKKLCIILLFLGISNIACPQNGWYIDNKSSYIDLRINEIGEDGTYLYFIYTGWMDEGTCTFLRMDNNIAVYEEKSETWDHSPKITRIVPTSDTTAMVIAWNLENCYRALPMSSYNEDTYESTHKPLRDAVDEYGVYLKKRFGSHVK